MNLKKCENGHYYDADKYSTCPHCSKAGQEDDSKTVNMQKTIPDSKSDGYMQVQRTEDPYETQENSGSVSLVDAVNVATSASVNWNTAEEDNDKTISYYGESMGTDPVVGWLVCVEGSMLGKAFELKNGKNFIGRSREMDIVLEGDMNVSRGRHAIVTYEPRGRVFIAQPGESRELFYMNDQVVLTNMEMHDRDVLLIGKTKLMFVPFCGPEFSWDDK